MMEIWGSMRKVERLPTWDCEAGYAPVIVYTLCHCKTQLTSSQFQNRHDDTAHFMLSIWNAGAHADTCYDVTPILQVG